MPRARRSIGDADVPEVPVEREKIRSPSKGVLTGEMALGNAPAAVLAIIPS
jgi:hypothetical protein